MLWYKSFSSWHARQNSVPIGLEFVHFSRDFERISAKALGGCKTATATTKHGEKRRTPAPTFLTCGPMSKPITQDAKLQVKRSWSKSFLLKVVVWFKTHTNLSQSWESTVHCNNSNVIPFLVSWEFFRDPETQCKYTRQQDFRNS